MRFSSVSFASVPEASVRHRCASDTPVHQTPCAPRVEWVRGAVGSVVSGRLAAGTPHIAFMAASGGLAGSAADAPGSDEHRPPAAPRHEAQMADDGAAMDLTMDQLVAAQWQAPAQVSGSDPCLPGDAAAAKRPAPLAADSPGEGPGVGTGEGMTLEWANPSADLHS